MVLHLMRFSPHEFTTAQESAGTSTITGISSAQMVDGPGLGARSKKGPGPQCFGTAWGISLNGLLGSVHRELRGTVSV